MSFRYLGSTRTGHFGMPSAQHDIPTEHRIIALATARYKRFTQIDERQGKCLISEYCMRTQPIEGAERVER